MIRGGNWNNGANAGVFYFNGNNSRALVDTAVGFRSALIRYSGGSGSLDNLDDEATDLSDAPQEIKDEIKANAEKLEDADDEKMHKEEQQMLSEIVRLVLAHQLTELYKVSGGADPDGFSRKAYEATSEEIQKAAALAYPLSQINIASELYRSVSQQLKVASTMTLTIGKEVADHE